MRFFMDIKNIPAPGFFKSLKYLYRMLNEDRSYVYKELAEHYGGIVTLKLPLKIVFIFSPQYIETVLKGNVLKFRKSRSYKHFFPLIGQGLVTAEGKAWQKQRKLASSYFSSNKVGEKFPLMTERTEGLIDDLNSKIDRSEKSLNTMKYLSDYTYDIITQSLFNFKKSTNEQVIKDNYQEVEKHLIRRIFSIFKLPLSINTKQNKQTNLRLSKLNQAVYNIINENLNSSSSSNSFLGGLLKSSFSKKIIRDEIVTYLLAGHETTNISITWTLALLAKNPRVLEKVRSEIEKVVGNEKLDLNHLNQLTYLKATIDESMRVFPPVPFLSREATEDVPMGNEFLIKKNSIIICSQFVTHRDKNLWNNPEDFHPERFLKSYTPYSFFPFAEGPRKCIGMEFSIQEIKCFFVYFLRNFNFSLSDEQGLDHISGITLRPKSDPVFTISRLKSKTKSE